jgi:hypothetical protein
MTLASQSTSPVLTQQPGQRSVPVLETERLVLRPPHRGDVKAIVRLVNDRRVAENTARIPHPYGVDDAERFLAGINRQDGEATFAITRGGDVIGVCGVEPRENSREIGYWLGALYWGRGYATEAVRAVIDHAFGCSAMTCCKPVRGSATRRRGGCLRNADSSGPASVSTVSAPSTRPRRSHASVLIAVYGRRSRLGVGLEKWRDRRGAKGTNLLRGALSGGEKRRELVDQCLPERPLWVRWRRMVHQLPALDQDSGMIERVFEVRTGMQALAKEGIAEIGPVAFGGAAE